MALANLVFKMETELIDFEIEDNESCGSDSNIRRSSRSPTQRNGKRRLASTIEEENPSEVADSSSRSSSPMYDLSQYQKPASELATAIMENTETMKKFFANYTEPTSRQSTGHGSTRQIPRRNRDDGCEREARSGDRKRRNESKSSGMEVKRIIIDFTCEEKVSSQPAEATVHKHNGSDSEDIVVLEEDAANRFQPRIVEFLRRWEEEEADTGEVEQFIRRELDRSNAKKVKCRCRICNEKE